MEQIISENAKTYRGVMLDKMTERGPRGGVSTYWRAAAKRDNLVASWSHTQKDAAKSAPGYLA